MIIEILIYAENRHFSISTFVCIINGNSVGTYPMSLWSVD